MGTDRWSAGQSDEACDRDDQVARLLWEYVNRLNSGERLDEGCIRKEHPELAEELIVELGTYRAFGSDYASSEPLGTLGDYTLRRQIGRGGMGVVYEAWENSMDRVVALKVLPGAVAADERALQRFVREAKVAGDLRHPNVVPVFGMGLKEKTPYYAMEYVEGETLAQVVAKVKDAEAEAETVFGKKDSLAYFSNMADAFADVADGLQHAHSKGVIHRDIKPSNLILDKEGRLRILDFGLARLEGQESLTISGDFVGTPLYMSPEQARRKRIPVDHRTDIYSLGATMYQALTGQPPFQGKDHNDTLSQIIERDPRPPRQYVQRIPGDLETIVLKCLRKDPGDRYGTTEALGQDLRRFVRGDPIEARPEASWEKAIRWTRRQVWRIAAAGIVSVLLVLVLWLTWEVQQAKRPVYDFVVTREIQTILRQRLAGSSPLRHDEGSFAPAILSETYGIEEAVQRLGIYTDTFPERPEAPFWQARGRLILEDEEGAREALDRALVANPSFAPARILRARLDGNAEDDDAIGAIAEWAWAWSDADAARASKDWARALEAYDELIRLRKWGAELPLGMPVELYLDRGVAFTELGRYDKAIRSFEVAAALIPGFLEPDLLAAKVYVLRGDADRAAALLEDVYQRGGKNDVVVRSILVVCDALGHFEKGLDWANRLSPGATRERLLCFFYQRTSQIDAAIAAGDRAVELDPDEAASYNMLAWTIGEKIRKMSAGRERGQEIEHRRRVVTRLLELAEKPGGEEFLGSALNQHAGVLFLDGEVEKALEACDRAIAFDENKTAVKATILAKLGRFAEAEPLYQKALMRDLPKSHTYGVLARVLGRLGRREEAIPMFEVWCERHPEMVADYNFVVLNLIAIERYEDALGEIRRAVELKARSVKKFQAAFFHAFWKAPYIVEASSESRALLAVLEAAQMKETAIDARGLTLLAFLRLHVSGELELSREDIDRAIRDASDAVASTERRDAEALAVLAECEYASGDGVVAVRILEEALELPEATLRHAELLKTYRQALPSELLEEDRSGPEKNDVVRPLDELPSSWHETGVLRINCGGKACKDADGNLWEEDAFFLGGRKDLRWPPLPEVDRLYHRQRSFDEGTYRPAYRIPLPAGTYKVTLDFVELFFGAAGLRSFDVIIEEREVLEIDDLFARVGNGEVDSWTRTVSVDDGALDIRFIAKRDSPVITAITIELDR